MNTVTMDKLQIIAMFSMYPVGIILMIIASITVGGYCFAGSCPFVLGNLYPVAVIYGIVFATIIPIVCGIIIASYAILFMISLNLWLR